MRRGWLVLAALMLPAVSSGARAATEAALVTSVAGDIQLREAQLAPRELKAFVKLRAGDRLTLAAGSRLQLVFFDGGREEAWQGPAALEIEAAASRSTRGSQQPATRTLPAVLVRQLAKTPAPDGDVRAGMIRLRSLPNPARLKALEDDYRTLRQQADAGDHTPELFLFAGYLELREFDALDSALHRLAAEAPADKALAAITTHYARALDAARKP